jgi:hypothetical protein
MTRVPRFSGKVHVEADAAMELAEGQSERFRGLPYAITAEDLQAEMGKPESERSAAAQYSPIRSARGGTISQSFSSIGTESSA